MSDNLTAKQQAFVNETADDIVELWDFSDTPGEYQSYSYQACLEF